MLFYSCIRSEMIDVYEEPGQNFYAFFYGSFEEVENYISIDDATGK